ncbi:MAG: hypothetical protein Q9220_007839 [cf. Caloplaca sp. 1 TL-2023]
MVPHVSEPPTINNNIIPPSLDTFNTTYPNTKKADTFILDQLRPPPQRRSTAPDSPTESPTAPTTTTISIPIRPRNRSPFARTHVRSRSSNSLSSLAPQMARAHSSPVPGTDVRPPYPTTARPSSPLGPPGRRRSPLRRSSDEPFSSFSNQIDIGETISENHELDLTPRAQRENRGSFGSIGSSDGGIPSSPILSMHNTFPRTRRRPLSPFQSSFNSSSPSPNYLNPPTSAPLRTSTSSPSLNAAQQQQFNEPFPSYSSSFSSSSIPSTPTSFRSRSPSISSLETIEDSPDAEIEAENIARLKAAADREDEASAKESDSDGGSGEEGGGRRRGVLGGGGGLGRSDKRKRWSVCGAERRGDLDLETIWED